MNQQECQICGKTVPNSLETHHIVPRRFGGSDQPENLVTLCADCHAAVEKIWDVGFYERLEDKLVGGRADVSPPEREYDGMDLDTHAGKDRTLPKPALHVEYSKWHPGQDEYVESWLLSESEIDAESVQEITAEQLYDLPDDDPLKSSLHHERELEMIHCGYCATVFYPWEHAKAARHLRVRHGIENPYEPDSETADQPIMHGDIQ